MKPSIETTIRPTQGHITVRDASDSQRESALTAALAAAGEWGVREGDAVEIRKPASHFIGGGALRDAVKSATRDARDAAKAALKSA